MIVNRKPTPKSMLQRAFLLIELLLLSSCIAVILFFLWLTISPFKYHACSDKATELHKAMYLTFSGECNLIDRSGEGE